jgi:hypothetical protein
VCSWLYIPWYSIISPTYPHELVINWPINMVAPKRLRLGKNCRRAPTVVNWVNSGHCYSGDISIIFILSFSLLSLLSLLWTASYYDSMIVKSFISICSLLSLLSVSLSLSWNLRLWGWSMMIPGFGHDKSDQWEFSTGSNTWRYVNVPYYWRYELWGYSLKFRPEK